MDYKKALDALKRFRLKADEVREAHAEAVEAANRFDAFAWCLPHLDADDELPRPRVEIYQTKSKRWVSALVVSEYGSVSPEDALKFMPFGWSETTGSGMPHRLEFEARYYAWSLNLPLYYGERVLNIPPIAREMVSADGESTVPCFCVSEPGDDGVWLVLQDPKGRSYLTTMQRDRVR